MSISENLIEGNMMDDLTAAAPGSFDALLEGSRVRLAEPEDLHSEVDAMFRELARAPHKDSSGMRRRRVVTGVVLSVALIGGGSAAAAASGLWSWWANDPDLTYEFTLPSGDTCEVRYGLFSTDPVIAPTDSSRLDPGLADWLVATNVLALADVDGAVDAFESGEVQLYQAYVDDDGKVTTSDAQQKVLDADRVYAAAVEYAVGAVINSEVTERGLPGLAYATETMCAEAIR